jgi:hypothetical protein
MSYATTNPPVCVHPSIGSHQALWLYKSEDVHTDVDASDYFSNGEALGMKVNDVVIVTKTTATVGATLHVVSAISAAGAATVTAAILA